MGQFFMLPFSSEINNVSASQLSTHLVGLMAALAVFFVFHRSMKSRIKLPGPTPWPIVGNWLQVGKDPAVTYYKWSKKYGPVFRVTLGEKEVVVVNTVSAAKELFTDQGSIYISRPLFHTFHKVVSSTAGFTIGTSPWDESCKRKRKAAATALNKVAVQNYIPIIDAEVFCLIQDLYHHSKGGLLAIDPYPYLQRFALNVSLVVNYGCRLESIGDELLNEIIQVETHIANFRPTSSTASDYIPLLRRTLSLFSNDSKARFAQQIRQRRDKYMSKLLNDLKQRVENGTDVACITGSILKDEEAKLSTSELSSICLSMVSAGLETLANTLLWSFGHLAQHVEIQDTAFNAIHEIYKGSIPDSSEEKINYIIALHKECSRYFSVLKLALPRSTIGDSNYRGIKIPDNTTVFLNTYAIHHDPERYGSDHTQFRPQRFLDPKLTSHYAFGIGRRICTGIHLANREMYIVFSMILYFFQILPSDSDPQFDIHPDTACTNPKGLSSVPKPYKIRFVPRDEKALSAWLESERHKFQDRQTT